MLHTLLLYLIVFGLSTNAPDMTGEMNLGDDWEHLATFEEGIVAPSAVRLLHVNDHVKVLLKDEMFSEHILGSYRFPEQGVVTHPVELGNGPGELSAQGLAISSFSDGRIFVWDDGNRRALVYAEDFGSFSRVDGLQYGLPGRTVLVNDSTVAVYARVPGPEILRIHRLNQSDRGFAVEREPLMRIYASEHHTLQPLADNPMLRQGAHRRMGDTLFLSWNYSSIIVAIDESGIQWVSQDAGEQPLPVYDFEEGDGWMVAPAADEFAAGVLDLAVDGDAVYVLFQPDPVSLPQRRLFAFRATEAERAVERARHSARLFILDRRSGRLQAERELPMRAKALDVLHDTIGLLSDEGDAPSLSIYRMPPVR
jgi:hypothetical protein